MLEKYFIYINLWKENELNETAFILRSIYYSHFMKIKFYIHGTFINTDKKPILTKPNENVII